MKGCARTCILWLVGWAVLGFAFSRYFYSLGDLGDGLWWAAGGAGLCVMLVLSYIIGIFNTSRERSLLLGAMSGTPPQDGKWSAAGGPIHSMHRLTAPLSGENVVAYHYKITRSEGSGKSRTDVTHFEGKGLVPSTISTRQGSVRLLSVPIFDVEAASFDHDAATRRMSEYIRTTPFETKETPKDQRQGTVDKESTDDDGNYRFDRRSERSDDVSLEDCSLSEFHIRQGENVCVFGLFSASRGGFIPHPNWAKQTRIMRGDTETVAAKLRKRIIMYFIGVIVFAAITYGIVVICQRNAEPREVETTSETFSITAT